MTRKRTGYPLQYKVIMHNDDVTTMDFVVKVLKQVFYKSSEDATRLMLDVHKRGSATVGVYSLDIAVSKANRAMVMARTEGFPFRLTVEPDDLPF